MTDTLLADRLAAVEARLSALENRLSPPAAPLVRFAVQGPTPPEVEEWLKRIGATGTPVGIEELHRMQLAEGADPTSTWCREEIERMREE